MSIAAAIFIIAIGAILRYATNINVQGVDFDTVGLILMIAGAAGLVLSFVYEFAWARKRREDAAVAAQQREAARQQQAYGQQQQPYQGQQPPDQGETTRQPPRY